MKSLRVIHLAQSKGMSGLLLSHDAGKAFNRIELNYSRKVQNYVENGKKNPRSIDTILLYNPCGQSQS